jgi:radical SAM superfamily enzyme YgiQ (UPF0313 family)
MFKKEIYVNKIAKRKDLKVGLIQLACSDYRHEIFHLPTQTFPMLAAATPPDVELYLTDESIEPIDYGRPVDLVGISIIIPFALKAYEIARRFRERGVTVVLGGHHVTALPQEAMQHADAVVTGEGDLVWPQLLEDFRNNRLKKIYNGGYVQDLGVLQPPRTDLLKARKYSIANAITATRRCPYDCSYCCVSSKGSRFRTRPVAHIVRDMENAIGNPVQKKIFTFWDDNLAGDRKYLKELYQAITPLRKRWITEAVLSDFAYDDQLTALAAKSGCRGVFCGIESFNQESLCGVKKTFNEVQKYKDYIKRLHDHGICVDAGMMVGFDEDDKSIFERTLETAVRLNIDAMSLFILSPYPNTPLFERLEKEGRILHRDWSLYDGHHVVFTPKHMSPEELFEGWRWVRREFYRFGSIAKRVWRSGGASWLAIPNNLSTRRAVRKEEKTLPKLNFDGQPGYVENVGNVETVEHIEHVEHVEHVN